MTKLIITLFILIVPGPVFLNAQSLYNEQTYKSLAGDNKAIKVGDLLTVQVYENSSALSSSDTSTQRNNGLGVSVSPQGKAPWGGTANIGSNFDGGGTTQRSNRLLAIISVTVREVLPNGEFKIAGDQLLTINEEQHKVHIEGRIRQQDISGDNTVLSSKIADAKINYVGDGDLTQRQRRAWWRHLLDWLGL